MEEEDGERVGQDAGKDVRVCSAVPAGRAPRQPVQRLAHHEAATMTLLN